MDQNPKNTDQPKPTIKKVEDSGGKPGKSRPVQGAGAGDKHYAKVRATSYRNAYSSVLTRLSSPSPRRFPPEDRSRALAKYFGEASNNGCRRTVSSYSKTKQFLEQCSKTLNARARKRQVKLKHPNQNENISHPRNAATESVQGSGTAEHVSLSEGIQPLKAPSPLPRHSSKSKCGSDQLVKKEEKMVSAEHLRKIEALSEKLAEMIKSTRDCVAPNLLETEVKGASGGLTSQETWRSLQTCIDIPDNKAEEKKEPPVLKEELPQENNLTAFDQEQPQQTNSVPFECDTNNHVCGDDFPKIWNPPPPCGNVGNCFSCSSFDFSAPYDFNSHHNLRRNCASADQFNCHFAGNLPPLGSYAYSNAPQCSENGTPDIVVDSAGKCIINSLCTVAGDGGRYFNIQGFEIAFFQSDMSNPGFERTIRMDFSTLGFMDPESFETEVDWKGNVFVFGNIFNTASKLWITVPQCTNPDRIIVENPAPYYFTIEIPYSSVYSHSHAM